uniref:Uncharacterized protein n=1 Tax=Anguilla anguilla TaxID=7936 RepID=A0A0E9SXQ5_ANGAN
MSNTQPDNPQRPTLRMKKIFLLI